MEIVAIENKWSGVKWNICIGNPPYDGNLHLKIINSVLPYLKEDGTASFIHPARWLQDPLAEYKKGTDKVRFANIVERLDDVKVIDNITVNRNFGILFNGDLIISKIRSKPTSKKISTYNNLAQDSVDVILSYSINHNLLQVCDIDKIDGWRCQIKRLIQKTDVIRDGNSEYSRKKNCNLFAMSKNNVFCDGFDENGVEWMNTKKVKNGREKLSGTPLPRSIKFNSKEEALNFQESCNTNFYNNIMYLLKIDMDTPLNFLPWMEDYSHPWTNEDYCEFFGKLGMSETCQKWMCRDVYDYRVKDFINYETFDEESGK